MDKRPVDEPPVDERSVDERPLRDASAPTALGPAASTLGARVRVRGRGSRFGLRAQLLLALAMLFSLAFAVLTVTSLRLSVRSSQLQARASAQRAANLLAHRLAALSEAGSLSAEGAQALLDTAQRDLALTGVEYVVVSGRSWSAGDVSGRGEAARAVVPAVGEVRLWLSPAPGPSAVALGRLLVFYAVLTAVAALALSFLLLTQLIVRPLRSITGASERLAAGDLGARAEVSGAAEVALLATSLNQMAEQLRSDRDDLEVQLLELRQTAQALHSTEDQLAHGDRLASVGRMAAGLAHEVGNPLAAILGFVELLQSGTLEERQRAEFLVRIRREIERIGEVIRGLLDFSRREPGERSAVDVQEVAAEAIALVKPLRAARNVRLVAPSSDSSRPLALASSSALRQVLVNLLINAVDAVGADPDREGQVAVDVSEDSDEAMVSVTVRDNGPGIDPSMTTILFEPFATTKAVGQGTGLGLAVAHGLVERMDGTLTVSDAEGAGAAFQVRLPAAADPGGA